MKNWLRWSLCASMCLGGVAPWLCADDKAVAEAPASITPQVKNPERHEQFLKRIKEGPVGLLFLGDSITDAWRSDQQKEIWEKYYGPYQPANFGIGGDQTQHVLWRLEHGELDGISPRVVVMMIGTNNLGNNKPKHTPEQVAEGVEKLVETVRQKLPDSKILLLGIFPRGQKADDPYRAMIKQTNERIAKLDDGKMIRYLDIGDKFLTSDGTLTKEIMPDALHPNTKGYQIWAEAMQPLLKELLGERELPKEPRRG